MRINISKIEKNMTDNYSILKRKFVGFFSKESVEKKFEVDARDADDRDLIPVGLFYIIVILIGLVYGYYQSFILAPILNAVGNLSVTGGYTLLAGLWAPLYLYVCSLLMRELNVSRGDYLTRRRILMSIALLILFLTTSLNWVIVRSLILERPIGTIGSFLTEGLATCLMMIVTLIISSSRLWLVKLRLKNIYKAKLSGPER